MQSSDAYAGLGLSFDHFHAKIQSLHVEVEKLFLDVHRDCLAECLNLHVRRQALDDTEKDDVESKLGLQPADEGAANGNCLLYTSDAADDLLCVDLGGRRIIKKKKKKKKIKT